MKLLIRLSTKYSTVFPDLMMPDLPFIQLNMHRATAAAVTLAQSLNNEQICFLTEPCTNKNKITQVPNGYACLPNITLVERPRAALFIPRTLPHIYLEQLSTPDCAAALLDTARGKILLASIYLDYNKEVIQDWLRNLVSFVEDRRLPMIMALDCNAHSQLYGPDTNARGKIFEEFILAHGLNVENRGDAPTYHAFRHGENIDTYIDVTLTKSLVPLQNWRVHDLTFNGSDHHTITWTLPIELKPRRLIRPWAKAKWNVFSKQISDYDFHIPETLNTRKVDKLLKRWYTVINGALDKACPRREAKLSPVELDWYGHEHKYLKNRAKRKYIAHRRSSCPEKRKAFIRAKNAYSRACNKGRRLSWRLFVEKTPDENNMATLFKIAQKRDKRSINTLLKPDNTLTEPGTETIQRLTDTHFPAAQPGITPYKHDPSHLVNTEDLEDLHEWIDVDVIRKAMRQFKPNKAPGPDGLKPIVFKYLPQNALEVLSVIYKACISLCHTPKVWRETKVIFLPKPGKTTYDIPKSYRPISLSNFLLKTLERLVVWRMEKDMEDFPIHHLQHGFTKGKCTESAISNTVDYIEQHLFDDQHCLGLFLDISSAFDSISIDHIRQKLLEHGGTPDMVDWYYSYLSRRYLEVELHGDTAHLTTATGFPQGGVCSAKFWLIAFDEAIRIINSNGVTGNGYADDCSALIGGTHTHNMIEQMQTMLDRLVAWGRTCGLQFNPQKTVAVMFTRAIRSFREVRMDGQLIPYSDNVVYLGVTLDSELKWRDHVHSKIKKAKGLLMKMANITRDYWGPKPKLMKWAYTGIVRPTLSYAALTWGHAIEDDTIITSLRRLNRLAMCTIVKVPRSTPTRAMQVILDIPPLHLHILKEGLSTYLRLLNSLPLNWDGVYTNLTFSVSHRRYWAYVAQDAGITEERHDLDDCCVPRPQLRFVLNTTSFVDMADCQKQVDCNVYTDGSKINDKVGAGALILRGNQTIATKIRLPDFATVYQAEVMAIKMAADILADIPDLTTVKFFVDSQAALRTLQSDCLKSRTALNMITALNKVQHEFMEFVWTKAHVGNPGNEEADRIAKEGTELDSITPVPTPACEGKNIVERSMRALWQREWDSYPDARQSKLYHAKLDKSRAKKVLSWNKMKLGRYIRAVTGHNNLLYHLHNIDNNISPTYRFCLDGREEFHHLANDCPALWADRQIICAQDPSHSTPDRWTSDQILEFALIPKIDAAFAKPLYTMNFQRQNNDPSMDVDDPVPPTTRNESESESDVSVMNVSSETESSSQTYTDSDVSITSDIE